MSIFDGRPTIEDRISEVRQSEQEIVQRLVDSEFNAGQHVYGHGQVYGGQMSTQLRELQLVQAWRQSPNGQWALEKAVVHRVHNDMGVVTVQFFSDQHRHMLPQASVKPILDFTPSYPKVRLAPGERVPTRQEIEQREMQADNMRKAIGIPSDAPLPGTEMNDNLLPGETMVNGRPAIQVEHWGIPGPTLEALRNRSVSCTQVRGSYGAHFYSNLYGKTYQGIEAEQVLVTDAGTVDTSHGMGDGRVSSNRFIPLSGPELVQDLKTGAWRSTVEEPKFAGVPQSEPWILG